MIEHPPEAYAHLSHLSYGATVDSIPDTADKKWQRYCVEQKLTEWAPVISDFVFYRLTALGAAVLDKYTQQWIAAQLAPSGQPAATTPRPATVNQRMAAMLQEDSAERVGWSAEQWATKLDCTAGAVKQTSAWKMIMVMRQQARYEKAKPVDRHRRPKKR